MLSPVAHEVDGHPDHPAEHRQVADPLERSLPEPHRERYRRVARQAVQLGTVAVGEHRHHRRPADARRIVDGRIREAVRLQLRDALVRALGSGVTVTDEASAIEFTGARPLLVEGDAANLKVTWPSDFILAERVLAARAKGLE